MTNFSCYQFFIYIRSLYNNEHALWFFTGLSIEYIEYIAFISRLISIVSKAHRALNIESNLARPISIQIPTQSPGRYTAQGWGQLHWYLYLPVPQYIFRVLACTLYLGFKNVLVLVPKYITKYLVLEYK